MSDVDEIPNEWRVTCSCGADGGTYDYRAGDGRPEYCPWCGAEVDGEETRVIDAETEPTALGWDGE
ncbi:hypothetical protein [Halobaculum sp. D14]|uniref:hypothetical protein n=1 Tax=Halobaculum sp. D14 TaxID=3421642 RepID=UPI003EB6BE14